MQAPEPENTRLQLEKLKAVLEALSPETLGSYPHFLKMLEIKNNFQRLEYLNAHRGEIERDREFLLGLFQKAWGGSEGASGAAGKGNDSAP